MRIPKHAMRISKPAMLRDAGLERQPAANEPSLRGTRGNRNCFEAREYEFRCMRIRERDACVIPSACMRIFRSVH